MLVSSASVTLGSRGRLVVRDLPAVNSSSTSPIQAGLPRVPPDESGSTVRPPGPSPTGELSSEAIPVNLTILSKFS